MSQMLNYLLSVAWMLLPLPELISVSIFWQEIVKSGMQTNS